MLVPAPAALPRVCRAKKMGVTIPQSILAQAMLVIDYDIRAPKAAK